MKLKITFVKPDRPSSSGFDNGGGYKSIQELQETMFYRHGHRNDMLVRNVDRGVELYKFTCYHGFKAHDHGDYCYTQMKNN